MNMEPGSLLRVLGAFLLAPVSASIAFGLLGYLDAVLNTEQPLFIGLAILVAFFMFAAPVTIAIGIPALLLLRRSPQCGECLLFGAFLGLLCSCLLLTLNGGLGSFSAFLETAALGLLGGGIFWIVGFRPLRR